MQIMSYLSTYIHYLIHPFKSHELLLAKSGELKSMTIGESIGISWVFIVLNGFIRIILINLVLMLFLNLTMDQMNPFQVFESEDGFLGFYFIILSTILDVIFYPLFMLFFIQFWEFVLTIFGSLLGLEDTDEKVGNIMTVAMSSNILTIIPVFGGIAQKFASVILIFAGIKSQLKASTPLTLCIMFFPALMGLGVFCLIILTYVVSLTV